MRSISNGYVADDLEGPLTPTPPQFLAQDVIYVIYTSRAYAMMPVSWASIPMEQGGHVPPIFMKGGHPW